MPRFRVLRTWYGRTSGARGILSRSLFSRLIPAYGSGVDFRYEGVSIAVAVHSLEGISIALAIQSLDPASEFCGRGIDVRAGQDAPPTRSVVEYGRMSGARCPAVAYVDT